MSLRKRLWAENIRNVPRKESSFLYILCAKHRLPQDAREGNPEALSYRFAEPIPRDAWFFPASCNKKRYGAYRMHFAVKH